MLLLGGGNAPAQGLGVILRHTDAVREDELAVAVGRAFVNLGGAVVPAAHIPMRVPAKEIGEAQLVLRFDVPLLGGAAIPYDGVADVAEHPLVLRVKQAEPVLRLDILGAGEPREPPRRIDVILARIGRERGPECPPPWRAIVAR